MTGNTGSLRYMAPEVALKRAYTELVDVYSFGILVWQMAKDKIPFKGFNKEEFLRNVVVGGLRPKIDKSWPPGFSTLLQRCWEPNMFDRPKFSDIVIELNKLVGDEGVSSSWMNRQNSTTSTITGKSTAPPARVPPQRSKGDSTWF
jgi:serine/threonine protein kinase